MSNAGGNLGNGAPAADNQNSPAGGGQAGRNSRNRNNNRSPRNADVASSSLFKGRNESMNGHVYDVPTFGKADQFQTTTKEMSDCVGASTLFKDCGGNLRRCVDAYAMVPIPMPVLPANPTPLEQQIHDITVIEVIKERRALERGVTIFFSLVIGQCTPAMREKLSALPGYAAILEALDGIALLVAIRGIAYDTNTDLKYLGAAVHESMLVALSCKQGKSYKDTVQKYYDRFCTRVTVAEQSGGSFLYPAIELFVAEELGFGVVRAAWTPAQLVQIRAGAREVVLAAMFLKNADPGRFSKLQNDTANDFTRGNDTYPRTVLRVYEILTHYVSEKDQQNQGTDGMSFNNVGEDGMNFNNAANVICHNCGKKGHYKSSCDKAPIGVTNPVAPVASEAAAAADGGDNKGATATK